PLDSPNIVEAAEGSSSADIQALLEKEGYLKG
ncbi:sucrose-phosphate synthase, partial [Trifolium medium]|nr:sucrose-phosphate synthase [Trifolium medium]